MDLFKNNKSFTLTIIPDSGFDAQTGNINLRGVIFFFAVLSLVFLACFFFIVGYHIKLHQESDYFQEVQTFKTTLKELKFSEHAIETLFAKIKRIQMIDQAFRLYAYMPVPDDGMYQAGIGGHVIVDNFSLHDLNDDLQVKLNNLALSLKMLDRQAYVIENSLNGVRQILGKRRDRDNNTPSGFPTFSVRISSKYGWRRNPVTGRREFHDAVDFAGKKGENIFATAEGVVTVVKYHPVRGKYILMRHKEEYGYETLYAHLDNLHVRVGQKVAKGQVIGTMGRTGRTTGANLHYCVILHNRKVNPRSYLY